MRHRWHQLIRTKKIQINGVFISTSLDDVTRKIRKALFKGTYENNECYFIEKYITKHSQIMEIGCGIGLVSLVASRICTEGFIKSYEANPKMEALIRKNYSLNSLEPNLEMKAVSTDGKEVTFFIDPDVISSSLFDRKMSHTKCLVQSAALDDILEEINPDTIIMDVEGAEVDLLGSSKLNGIKQMIVEIHPHIVGEEKISRLNQKLQTSGFQILETRGKVCVYSRG